MEKSSHQGVEPHSKEVRSRQWKTLPSASLMAAWMVFILGLVQAVETGDAELKSDLTKARTMAKAESRQEKEFQKLIQKLTPHFQTVPVAEGDSTNRFFKVELNRLGAGFDGIRFKASPGEDRKLIWIFSSSKKNPVIRWMMADSRGAVQGYHTVDHSEGTNPEKSYFGNAYDLYVPWGREAKNKHTIIHVIDVYEGKMPIKAGEEYVIWLVFKDDSPVELQAAITLTPAKTELMNTWEKERALDLFE